MKSQRPEELQISLARSFNKHFEHYHGDRPMFKAVHKEKENTHKRQLSQRLSNLNSEFYHSMHL